MRPPPPKPITDGRHHLQPQPLKPTSLPDLFLTAISLLFLFSSPKPLKFPVLSFPSNPRRFLRIPSTSMSLSLSKIHHFANPQSLSDWLKPRLPSDSFASWGVKPGTKNVHNLWLELAEGETSLADATPPIRSVNVVIVRIIGADDRVLVESHQELSDGSVRIRGRPLSEKMKPNEYPEEAVFRAVKEELGSIIHNPVGDSGIVKIVPGSYQKKVEERSSASYPGLPARYVLHTVDAWVEGLPEGEFSTEEKEEYALSEDSMTAHSAISVKKHFWKWVSADSLQC